MIYIYSEGNQSQNTGQKSKKQKVKAKKKGRNQYTARQKRAAKRRPRSEDSRPESDALMELIINKFKNIQTYRKLNSLWSQYKQVAHLENNTETYIRLKKFLDHAQKTIQEYIEKHDNKLKIEEIICESSDVLSTLFEYIHNYQKVCQDQNQNLQLIHEIMNQVLELADFILSDAKYRKQLENSQVWINEFLKLVEMVEKSESKIIIIKLIMMMTDNIDTKLEFVKNEGFGKLLSLLISKDERISQIISKALFHFLQIPNAEDSKYFEEMQQQLTSGHKDKDEIKSIKFKFKKLVMDIRKFTIGEISKIFADQQLMEQQGQVGSGTQSRDSKGDQADLSQQLSGRNSTPQKFNKQQNLPNNHQLFNVDMHLILKMMADERKTDQKSTFDEDEEIKQTIGQMDVQNATNEEHITANNNNNTSSTGHNNSNNIFLTTKPLTKEDISIISVDSQKLTNLSSTKFENQEEFLKEFTIVQGGFKAILKTLECASQEVQIDLMGTITKLLNFDNKFQQE